MLAHLTRKRLNRFDHSTGEMEYQDTALRFSGTRAQGDDLDGPVCAVIDVGRAFIVTCDGLYLTGAGKCQHQTFTPEELFLSAKQGYFGFTLLWDEADDAEEVAINEGVPAHAEQ